MAQRRRELVVSGDYWSAPQLRFLWQNRQNRHMKNSLPWWSTAVAILTGSLAIAQNGTIPAAQATRGAVHQTSPAAASPHPPGNRLLVQALNQLERRRSATARLSYDIWLGGERLSGRGSYWQQGSGEDLHICLDLQMIGQDSRLLQVSDSRLLWIDRRLPLGRTVSQINLRQLRADAALTANSFENIRPGEASWSPTRLDLLACYGGLPRLIASLCENFAFMPPQAMRLVSPGASPQASIPYFAVVGHWKPDRLAMLAGGQPGVDDRGPESGEAMAGRVPKEVLLLFGQADLFPYRVEYRQHETRLPAGPNSPPPAYQLSANPIVALEFSDVAFDVPIAAGQFDYAPGDIDWVDQTAAVLERMHRERQAKVATRTNNSPSPAPTR
jgi:hypothetical protein